jgi:hypothetical protein
LISELKGRKNVKKRTGFEEKRGKIEKKVKKSAQNRTLFFNSDIGVKIGNFE